MYNVCVCVSVYSGVLKQVSHGDGHSLGSRGDASALPRGSGEAGPNYISVPVGLGREPWGRWGGGGQAGCTNLDSACAYICHVYVLGTVACASVVSLVGAKQEGLRYCGCSVSLTGRSFHGYPLPEPNKGPWLDE